MHGATPNTKKHSLPIGCTKDNDPLADKTTMHQLIESYVAIGNFSGVVLVGKNDHIIFQEAYGMANYELDAPNTIDMKFRIGSLTKVFTAAAIADLQSKDALHLDNYLSDYFPDYPHGDTITILNLLNHSSGILNYTALPDYHVFKKLPATLETLHSRFKDKPLEFTPGSKQHYSNSNYRLLADIIEKISGLSYEEYLKQYIFAPLNMCNSGVDNPKTILKNRTAGYDVDFKASTLINADYIDMSVAKGAGDLYASIHDLYLFIRSIYKQKLFSVFDNILKAQLDESKEKNSTYGWGIDTLFGKKLLARDGQIDGFHAVMYQFIEDDMSVIVLSNFKFSSVEPIARGLAAIAFKQPYEIPKKHIPTKIDPTVYDDYIGIYQDSQPITIIKENNQLFSQTKRLKLPLLPRSETEFFIPFMNSEISFIKDTDSNIIKIIMNQDGVKRILEKKS